MKTFQQAASLVALAALGTGMLAISMTAQARGNDHQRLDWLVEQLELSSEQATSIGLLMEAHREQMQSIDRRGENGRPGEQARDQARAARQALHEEIDAVLTEQQRAEFAGLMEARRQHGRRAGRMGYSMGYFTAALDSLDLSDDQRQAIQALVQNQRTQGRSQRQAFRAELESILTEDQLAELDAMRERRSSRRRHGHHGG